METSGFFLVLSRFVQNCLFSALCLLEYQDRYDIFCFFFQIQVTNGNDAVVTKDVTIEGPPQLLKLFPLRHKNNSLDRKITGVAFQN
jgi:hypothetical protein